jgi:hypothetical protein
MTRSRLPNASVGLNFVEFCFAKLHICGDGGGGGGGQKANYPPVMHGNIKKSGSTRKELTAGKV